MRRNRSDRGPRIEFEEPAEPQSQPAPSETWSETRQEWQDPEDWGISRNWEQPAQTEEAQPASQTTGWTTETGQGPEEAPEQAYTQQPYQEPAYREPSFQEPAYQEPVQREPAPQSPAFRGQARDHQGAKKRQDFLDEKPGGSVWRKLLWVVLVMVAILVGLVIYSLVGREPQPVPLKPVTQIAQPDNSALTSRMEVLENRIVGLEERLKALEAK